MYIHPTTGAALAEQHRRDLMSQASASRQARAARQASSRNQARRPLSSGPSAPRSPRPRSPPARSS